MTIGYEAKEAILKALGTGQPEAAAAMVALWCPDHELALEAVRYCTRLQRLYRCRAAWNKDRAMRDQIGPSDFGLREAIRITERQAEQFRHALHASWPQPTGEEHPLF